MNWEIVKAQLEDCGITCDRARNGRECVQMFRQAPAGTYDAIFMDIQMPEMNGREAACEIRSLPEEKDGNIPIIAMTADAFAEDIQACKACGMNGHIAKPIDSHALRGYLAAIKNKTAEARKILLQPLSFIPRGGRTATAAFAADLPRS